MGNIRTRLVNICPVFLVNDVKRTVKYYSEQLGFKFAKHYDKIENFATIYRDSIEIVIVQAKFGEVESNQKRYGEGYDAYIDPDSVEGVDVLYREFSSKDVKIISEPKFTEYGSYEFVIEDIDGRLIGIGRIANNDTFFKSSNYI